MGDCKLKDTNKIDILNCEYVSILIELEIPFILFSIIQTLTF